MSFTQLHNKSTYYLILFAIIGTLYFIFRTTSTTLLLSKMERKEKTWRRERDKQSAMCNIYSPLFCFFLGRWGNRKIVVVSGESIFHIAMPAGFLLSFLLNKNHPKKHYNSFVCIYLSYVFVNRLPCIWCDKHLRWWQNVFYISYEYSCLDMVSCS